MGRSTLDWPLFTAFKCRAAFRSSLQHKSKCADFDENFSLIERQVANSIPVLNGRNGNDGIEARSASCIVL